MIYDCIYGPIHGRHTEVINYIIEKKKSLLKYEVIDVGASLNSWCDSQVSAIVDIIKHDSNKLQFIGNINQFDVWENILDYVKYNEKFDFSICTHTLEDISNPVLVANMLSKISKSGFVSFPSKYFECARNNSMPFRGWMHHRWIFNYEKDRIVGYPKLPVSEYVDYLNKFSEDKLNSNFEELSFFWDENCNLQIVNDDYFPSESYIVECYKSLLD